MGLDAYAFKNIQRTDLENEVDFTAYVVDEKWNYKIKNLEIDKGYKGDACSDSISYAYSGHSRFRESLIRLIDKMYLLDDS